MKNFEGFGLSTTLNNSLENMGYTTPTPIQTQAIPLAQQGRDILGSAQTGTGKTAAFGIPLVEAILASPRGSALVLTPTRELAQQVLSVIHQLIGPKSPIKTAFLIGGDSMAKQLNQIKLRPRIIVGTPGRINDHLERGSLMLHDAGFLVMDETDRMLDMGFGVQIDRILKFLPAKRQTLMFSATLPKGIERLSSKYLTNPERISVGETNVIAKNIKHEVIKISQDQKLDELIRQLHEREGSVIVFNKTKYGSEKLAKSLIKEGFKAGALHGDLRQSKRTQVMNNFRQQKFKVLVATDIAARGLDVPHIEHVVNFDMPQAAEDYIHRMGRTARAGASGSALCFVSPQDMPKWRAIERLLDPTKKDEPRSERRSSRGRSKPGRGNFGKSSFSKGGFGKKSFSGKPANKGSGSRFSDNPRGGSESRGRSEREDSSEGRSRSFSDRPRGSSESRGNSEGRSRRSFSDKPRGNSESRGNSDGRSNSSSSDKGTLSVGYKSKKSFSGKPGRSSDSRGVKNFSSKPRSANESRGRPTATKRPRFATKSNRSS